MKIGIIIMHRVILLFLILIYSSVESQEANNQSKKKFTKQIITSHKILKLIKKKKFDKLYNLPVFIKYDEVLFKKDIEKAYQLLETYGMPSHNQMQINPYSNDVKYVNFEKKTVTIVYYFPQKKDDNNNVNQILFIFNNDNTAPSSLLFSIFEKINFDELDKVFPEIKDK